MTTSKSKDLDIVDNLLSICYRLRDALHQPDKEEEINKLKSEICSEAAKLPSITTLRLPFPADMEPAERERALEQEVMRLQAELISLKQEVVREFIICK